MTTSTTNTTSATSKVDALYGPGTLLGWYLTLAACFVSWTLHPRSRMRDSLDPDLIISLTLPLVAIVHLISQASKLAIPQTVHLHTLGGGSNEFLQEKANAIEAPLVVTEVFMNIAAVMFTVACYFVKIRRALVVGAVFLASFATDCFLHASRIRSTGLSRLFSRSFIADSAIALIVIGLSLAFLLLATFVITLLFFHKRQQKQKRQIQEAEQEARDLEIELHVVVCENVLINGGDRDSQRNRRTFLESLQGSGNIQRIHSLTFGFLILSLVASIMSISTGSQPLSTLHKQPLQLSPLDISIHAKAPGLRALFFPKSNSSLKDLDQKVAVLAGLTVLAFGLYPVLNLWYRKLKNNQMRALELRQAENMRLRRLILEGQGMNLAQLPYLN